MKPAARSCPCRHHARIARTWGISAAVVMLSWLGASAADEPRMPRGVIAVPAGCLQYGLALGDIDSPVGWTHLLSFAACIQDSTVMRIDRPDQVADLVDQLQANLLPAEEIYAAIVEQGPEPVRVRAALQIAMAEIAMVVRARSSIAAPADLATNATAAARYRDLHARLEPLLEPVASLACTLVAQIDNAVAIRPSLAADPATRQLLASARELAAQLRRSLSIPAERVDRHIDRS